MRRNKPRQRGVREARPAGGAGLGWRPAGGRPGSGARCSRTGEGGGPPFTSRCPRRGQQLSPGTFFPTQVVLFTNRSIGAHFYLLPSFLFLGGHRMPKGEAQLGGHTRAVGGPDCWGRTGEAFCCFRGNRQGRRAPPSPAAEPWPVCSGDPAPTTRTNHRGEVLGLPVVLQREVKTVSKLCVLLFSLCV